MKKWMTKMAMKNYQFMQGRNGLDEFGRFLFIGAIVIDLVAMILQNSILTLIAIVMILWEIFRFYSRNVVKRSIENNRYKDFITISRRTGRAIRMRIKDRRNHYYLCPNCHQIVRVPKGHGKIEITCPSCHTSFEKKS